MAAAAAAPTRRVSRSAKRAEAAGGAPKRSLRTATLTKTVATEASLRQANRETARRQAQIASRQKANPTKRRFTQEELLIEAATVTEPENERWILGRKRIMEEAEVLQDALHGRHHHHHRGGGGGGGGGESRVVSKFHSRRGCLNTITFPDMDMVPAVLSGGPHKHHQHHHRRHGANHGGKHGGPDPTVCIITGKKARYRDPKTMLGYHDLAAFKELRRRLARGELKNPLEEAAEAPPVKKEKKAAASRGKGRKGPILVRVKLTKLPDGVVHGAVLPPPTPTPLPAPAKQSVAPAAVTSSSVTLEPPQKKHKVVDGQPNKDPPSQPVSGTPSSSVVPTNTAKASAPDPNPTTKATAATDSGPATAKAAPTQESSSSTTPPPASAPSQPAFDAKAAAMLAARNAAAEVVAKAASATNSSAKGGKGIVDKETIAAATKAAVVAAIRASTPPRRQSGDGRKGTPSPAAKPAAATEDEVMEEAPSSPKKK